MKPLLSIKNLHTNLLSHSKKIRAVRDVSFDLEKGETVGIVGESGCGKSIMAKSITRLLPSVNAKIEQGEIFYKNKDLLKNSESEMRKIRGKEIGMIFQDPMTSLNPTMKIGKQVEEGYRLHHPKATNEEIYTRVIDLLSRVGLSEVKDRYNQLPHELSGGMRQRIMIAIAIIAKPHILIADEPTTALDVTVQAQILELLKNIQKKENMSILLITHDFSIVSSFCDRVLVMYSGEIIEMAPVDQLFKSPKHPYTKRLLQSIPRLDLEEKNQLYCIHGTPPDLSSNFPGCNFQKRCPDALEICQKHPPTSIQVNRAHSVNCFLYRNEKGKFHE